MRDGILAAIRRIVKSGSELVWEGRWGQMADSAAELVRMGGYLWYPCPFCGTRLNRCVKRHGSRVILACPNCSLCYVAPPPSLRDLDTLYANPAQYEKSIGGAGMSVQEYEKVMLRRGWVLEEIGFAAWEAERGPERRMLEIGCFDGSHLMLFRSRGWNVEGIEITPTIAAKAAERGIKVHGGRIEELDLPDESYDFVTLNHTFEHLHNPGAVLREVRRILRRGGRMIIQVPREDPCWEEGREHLIFLTCENLTRMLSLAGFRVLAMFEKSIWNPATHSNWVELTCYSEKQSGQASAPEGNQ